MRQIETTRKIFAFIDYMNLYIQLSWILVSEQHSKTLIFNYRIAVQDKKNTESILYKPPRIDILSNIIKSEVVMINLYIDHQNVAPLIYSLEDILDKALEQNPDIGQKHQLRRPLYEAFANILYALHPQSQDGQQSNEEVVKLEEGVSPDINQNIIEGGHLQSQPHELLTELDKQLEPKQKVRTRGRKQMEVELALMGWMMSEDRKVFEKKEIVEKYNQLWESEKKTLTMEKLMKMLEKFKMWNVIIRDRKGVEHFLRYDMNSSIATVVKREEISVEISKAYTEKELMGGKSCGDLDVVPEKKEQESDEKEDLIGGDDNDNLFYVVDLHTTF